MKKRQKIYLPFKRLIGILGSIAGIIFCGTLFWWWIIPINAIVTRGHPFFASQRVGQKGKRFMLIKFRSMNLSANPHMTSRDGNVQNEVTKFGKFLRRTSLDETPQLFNIFVGQMAFIGPRPLIDVNGDIITIDLRRKNGSIVLKPGLSGYAQIHKRGDLDPKSKAMYDGIYLEHFSLWWDTKIFVYTLLRLLGPAKGR